jgi:hypothetical protein
MNVLSFEQQVSVIAALTEGCSIRSTERLTGVHRDTIVCHVVRLSESQTDQQCPGFMAGVSEFASKTATTRGLPRIDGHVMLG